MTKRIAVLTTGRQDWGILRSTCVALSGRCNLRIWAAGMACDPQFGDVATVIAGEGFETIRLPWSHRTDAPESALAAACTVLGKAMKDWACDALLMVGDRFETAAVALAATVLSVPVVHLHGGEETEGAFDNALRHAITKLAHLHFVSHETYAERVRQMGEPSDAVMVVGAPGLDNLRRQDLPTAAELERTLGIALEQPLVLVTVHPETLSSAPSATAIAVAAAMDAVPATYVVTLPNADPGADQVREIMKAAGSGPKRVAKTALGERNYWGLLKLADAVLGNSSSAVIEAPSLHLPAVNVGDRQAGRLRAISVIDVKPTPEAVIGGLQQALRPEFRAAARLEKPTFGDGTAGRKIADRLLAWHPQLPLRKRFVLR